MVAAMSKVTGGSAVPYVPMVDISGDPDVAGAELDEICRTTGFFQITGHGIPGDVAEQAWALATKFFDLPLEDKLSVARPTPDYPYGYMPLAGESLSQSIADAAPPDLKEVFNIGPPGRRRTRSPIRTRRGPTRRTCGPRRCQSSSQRGPPTTTPCAIWATG
jgi:isopenicillin N synthase-like dioxygenase